MDFCAQHWSDLLDRTAPDRLLPLRRQYILARSSVVVPPHPIPHRPACTVRRVSVVSCQILLQPSAALHENKDASQGCSKKDHL